MTRELTPELVETVRDVVTRHARRTPLLKSDWLSALTGGEVFLKCENLQVTGSFKVRGALAAVERLSPAEREAGVVTSSAGNHGLGLARAAAVFGIPCTVVVSQTVPEVKESGILAQGAEVVRSPHDGYDDTQDWTLEHLSELGGTFVSPFEDVGVMAGNGGTTMLEILEEMPELDAVVVPCGGGGMANGLGVVAKARGSRTRVIGVNTEASPGMWLSRREGRARLQIESAPTIAEGIEGGVGELTFQLGQRFIDDIVLVTEEAIHGAVADLVRRERMIVEGSGAAGVAAVMEGCLASGRTCVVLTGSNIDSALLVDILAGSENRETKKGPVPKDRPFR